MSNEFDFDLLKTNGIKVNYLYICKRKLWLFDRGVQMESTSDRVLQGKITEQYSYPAEEKRKILIENLINIDIINKNEIREVKFSNRISQADKIQLLYYLYFLKKMGVMKRGVINYPKMRRKEEVELTPETEKEVENALIKIKEIVKMPNPPPIEKLPYCKKCSYYEFCYS
ncbi:MAG: CRISPR-associated protein Cas4 [Acidobacteria bacterium]|nr:CRISPR-associated protein Cas4 [Acidobacteriota bacterium]